MDDLLPNVSTAQLCYLVAITRHRTWAEAAASLGVTPSALSQGIAELERRLGVPLFATDGRRRVPHDHTAALADCAERVLADLDQTTRWLRAVGAGRVGRLRIGMIDIAAVHHCRDGVQRFRDRHPELDVGFTVAPTGALLDSLERNDLDVVVCVDPEGAGAFDTTPLLRDDLAVVVTTDFFTPIVDDPFDWGRIAATNALSDVYAMGGTPLLALNLVAWPREQLPFELLARVLDGGATVARDAGCLIAGGHSIDEIGRAHV